jgi:poly(A) polymerase
VTNARVPIITFVYRDTDIDISFCQLNQETVPRDIERVITNDLVESITDEKSQTSLLGRKNNLMILELTGKQIENFKETLRVVKVWAKTRGISSNGMGYLGGISWAILVAKICQIFPQHKPMQLLREFFLIYSMWSWKTMPLTIMKCKYKETAKNIMCIITPGSVYNSTERVN